MQVASTRRINSAQNYIHDAQKWKRVVNIRPVNQLCKVLYCGTTTNTEQARFVQWPPAPLSSSHSLCTLPRASRTAACMPRAYTMDAQPKCLCVKYWITSNKMVEETHQIYDLQIKNIKQNLKDMNWIILTGSSAQQLM